MSKKQENILKDKFCLGIEHEFILRSSIAKKQQMTTLAKTPESLNGAK